MWTYIAITISTTLSAVDVIVIYLKEVHMKKWFISLLHKKFEIKNYHQFGFLNVQDYFFLWAQDIINSWH